MRFRGLEATRETDLADLFILGGGNVSSASRRTSRTTTTECVPAGHVHRSGSPLLRTPRQPKNDDVSRCTAHVPPFSTPSRMARDQLFSKRLDMADQAQTPSTSGVSCRVSRRPAEQLWKRKGGGVGCEGVPWRILMAAGAEHQTVERRPQTGRRSPRAVAGHRVLGSTGKRRAHRLPKQPPITPTREHSFGSREACDAL